MSRPMVLVFMLILLVITSQLEWKQPLVNELEMSPSTAQKEKLLLRREAVKEKVILAQEKSIRKLNELVRKLQEELQQCRSSKAASNETGIFVPEISSVLEEANISQN
ncbi:unnamed protein product [Victoria cruziana]